MAEALDNIVGKSRMRSFFVVDAMSRLDGLLSRLDGLQKFPPVGYFWGVQIWSRNKAVPLGERARGPEGTFHSTYVALLIR